jgi:hypothetical protein
MLSTFEEETRRRPAELDGVAEPLFLSPKTVEWSLTMVYRKLRVRSHAELAAKLGGGALSGQSAVQDKDGGKS